MKKIIFLVLFVGVLLFAQNVLAAFDVTTMDVYRSSSTTLDSDTSVCTGVSVASGSPSCSGTLYKESTYRIEFTAVETGGTARRVDRTDFKDVYASNDVIGSDATLVGCGCWDDGTHKTGTISTNANDVRCTFTDTDATACVVESGGGSEDFYFLITPGTNAASQSGKLYAQDGGTSDVTPTIDFTLSNIVCGNNLKESTETCDGTALNSQTCVTQGFASGTLSCAANCLSFVTSSCTNCGNNIVNSGETCDGTALNSQTCVLQGFFTGTLSCKSDCSAYNTTPCTNCGNNIIDSGETCDGTALSGATCQNRGYDTGALSCASGCGSFVTSSCSFFSCGNGVKEGNESCDGSALGGATCSSRGFNSGTLACASNCDFNTGGCQNNVCGDGVCGSGESCSSCSGDCGSCPPQPQSGGGGTLSDMSIQVISPETNQVFKSGEIPIKIKLLSGTNLLDQGEVKITFNNKQTSLYYSATSKLFEGTVLAESLKEGSYTIQISATKNNFKDAKTSASFNINSKLNIAYNLDPQYILGNEILIKGSATDFLNAPITANLTITGSVGKIKMFEKNLESNGTFEYRYKTSFFDVEGNWTIEVIANDKYGNSGIEKKSVLLKLVSEGGFYNVKFLSPPPNFVYKRGESIKLTVEVEKDGSKVVGSNFTFRNPDGSLLFLKEVSPGIYSADYKIDFDAPYGSLPLYVVGFKEVENTTLTGAAQLPINVEKAKITLDILSPLKDELIVGKPVEVIVKASYSDGSTPENLDIYTKSPAGEKISLVKKGENYVGNYKPKEGEEGIWKMQIESIDPYENTGSKLATLRITGITPLYIILENWLPFTIIIVLVVASGGFVVYKNHEKNYFKNLEKELKKLTDQKKEAQTKYFKEGSINKATYQELIENYEERESDLRKKLTAKKQKLKGKK